MLNQVFRICICFNTDPGIQAMPHQKNQNLYIYLLSSVGDPWHFGADPDADSEQWYIYIILEDKKS